MMLLVLILILLISPLVLTSMGLIWQFRPFSNKSKEKNQRLKITSRIDHTDQLFTLILKPYYPWQKTIPFHAGQYLEIEIPISKNQIIKRCYSLADWAENASQYEVSIKKEEKGLGSTWLWQHAQQGKTLVTSKPKGHFILQPNYSKTYVLVAGGIGITPMRAMWKKILKTEPEAEVHLFYSAKTRESLLYYEELAKEASQKSNFHLHGCVSKNIQGWSGLCGRLDAEYITKQLKNDFKEADYYFCASSQMMESLKNNLSKMGVAKNKLNSESFGFVNEIPKKCHNPCQVSCGLLNIKFEHPTLFHCLEANNMNINGHCRAGQCGGC
ncbi:MAG: FAD-binding oxidoreductase, partial [Cytophagales bacterium]